MKVSELIKALEQTIDEVGDLDVAVLTDTPDGLFYADINPIAGVVQLPVDDNKPNEVITVFAVGWNGMFNEEGPVLDSLEDFEAEETEETLPPKLLH